MLVDEIMENLERKSKQINKKNEVQGTDKMQKNTERKKYSKTKEKYKKSKR